MAAIILAAQAGSSDSQARVPRGSSVGAGESLAKEGLEPRMRPSGSSNMTRGLRADDRGMGELDDV
jgi:hypothetical protein